MSCFRNLSRTLTVRIFLYAQAVSSSLRVMATCLAQNVTSIAAMVPIDTSIDFSHQFTAAQILRVIYEKR